MLLLLHSRYFSECIRTPACVLGGGGVLHRDRLFVDVLPAARDDGLRIKTDKTSVLSTITKTFSQQQLR
jgi:hypothetical protein